MLVVDTSAALAALIGAAPPAGLVHRLAEADELAAPHLIDVEVLHALRRLVRRGELTADRATDARIDFADLAVTRYPHEPLADAIWAWRDDLSAYDAAFVALAEALGVPLVTCDARLARSAARGEAVELYPPAG